jgi:hypothetical protein
VLVEVEVWVVVAAASGDHRASSSSSGCVRRRLERRTLRAHAWVVGRLGGCGVAAGGGACPGWRLEDYIGGGGGVKLPMRISGDGTGDEGRGMVEEDDDACEERVGTVETTLACESSFTGAW